MDSTKNPRDIQIITDTYLLWEIGNINNNKKPITGIIGKLATKYIYNLNESKI